MTSYHDLERGLVTVLYDGVFAIFVTTDYNIKTDIQQVGCEGMDWIELAQDRDRWRAPVNAVMSLWIP